MVVNRLLAVRKADSQLPHEVRAALVDYLYGPFTSLAFGAASGAIISAMVAYRANDPWLFACFFAICFVGLGRIAVALAYRHRSNPAATEFSGWWELAF